MQSSQTEDRLEMQPFQIGPALATITFLLRQGNEGVALEIIDKSLEMLVLP